MTTTRDVITGALRNLKMLDALATAAAEDAAVGLEKLNDMMFAWAADGVDVNHSALTLESPFTLADRHVRGVKALLAIELQGVFGKQASADVVMAAQNGWDALLAEYGEPEECTFDSALVRTPSNIASGLGDI